MKDVRRLKRAQFLLTGSALGLAACSNATFTPLSKLAPFARQATTRRLKNRVTTPAALFQGYNSVLGSGCSTAVTGDVTRTGSRATVRCSVCTTASEVATALGIDASLSVAYGPLASANVKTEFMSRQKITTYSVTLVVHAINTIGTESFSNVKLKPDLQVLPTDAQSTNDFVSTYGDSWISSISKGGEYFATYNFYSETSESQQDLRASIEASGIIGSVSVAGSVQTEINSLVTTSKVTTTFDQAITGVSVALPSPANIVDFALAFSSLTPTAPEITGFESKGYESAVEGFKQFDRQSWDKVVQNRKYFVMGDSANPALAKSFAKVAGIKNQIEDLKSIYDFYGYTGDPILLQRLPVANSDFDAIVAQIQLFESAATSTFPKLSLPSIQTGSPVFGYVVFVSPEFVHGNGEPFDDVPDASVYLHNRTRIKQVQLRSGDYVDKIITTYEDKNGTFIAEHGENGGKLSNALRLSRGQYVVGISGSGDAVIDRLKIAITGGQYLEAGGKGGFPFSWTTPNDRAIVMGFRGYKGTYHVVDKIGITYAYIKPAQWIPV